MNRNITSDQRQKRNDELEKLGCLGGLAYTLLIIIFIFTFPVSIFFAIYSVKTYERAIVFRFGRIKHYGNKLIIGAGLHFVLPLAEKIQKIDLRTRTLNIKSQEIITEDILPVLINASVFVRVIKPVTALLRAENAYKSAKILAISALRTILSQHNLAYILSNRYKITNELNKLVEESSDDFGIQIERIEITDIVITQKMQHSMAIEAQTFRRAKANVISAQSEFDIACALKEAATELTHSPLAMHLRCLQTLMTIAGEQNSTIILPFPVASQKSIQPISSKPEENIATWKH